MRITNIIPTLQVKSRTERSYAGKNRIDTSSRNDLTTALRRIKAGDSLNTTEINALTKNGYDPQFNGEDKGTIHINGESHNFTVETDSQ